MPERDLYQIKAVITLYGLHIRVFNFLRGGI